MRIFGLEINRATPPLRVAGSSFAERNTVAAIALAAGRQVIQTPSPTPGVSNFRLAPKPPTPAPYPAPQLPVALGTDRVIPNDPRDSWALALPNRLSPAQVITILRAALAGDSYRAFQLQRLMLESWPMFRKCQHELRDPVCTTRYVVKEYGFTGKGRKVSPLAHEKADLIRRAMANFAPAPFTDERGWHSMVYDLCDAVNGGSSAEEMLWHPLCDWGGGKEILPRAAAWAHPRHFNFSQFGILTRNNPGWSQMFMFDAPPPAYSPAQALDPTKFLFAQFKSGSGSTLAEGFMRPLAIRWAYIMFAQELQFLSAQNHGAPWVDCTYPKSFVAKDLDDLEANLRKGMANRYFMHLEGSVIESVDGKAMGSQDPQQQLMDKADQVCMELYLGTEASTKSQAGKLGGSNANDPQAKKTRERVQGVTNWLCNDVLPHFVAAVLYRNYCRPNAQGLYDPQDVAQALVERPTIEPDFTEPLTAQEKGTVMQALATCKTWIPLDDYYAMIGTATPAEGDPVINPSTGEIGELGAMDEEVNVAQAVPEPPAPPVKLDENNNPIPAKTPEQAHGIPAAAKDGEDDNFGKAQLDGVPVNRILARATTEELEQLIPIVEAAEKATTKNGEHALLTRHLLKIKARK